MRRFGFCSCYEYALAAAEDEEATDIEFDRIEFSKSELNLQKLKVNRILKSKREKKNVRKRFKEIHVPKHEI